MGAVQTRLVQVSLAKQTAKGAAAATPAFTVGLTGGKVYDVELSESELDTTWDTRVLAGYDRDGAVPISDLSLISMPKSTGLLMFLTMGADAVTGVASVFTHTFTFAPTLPYSTVWGKFGAGGDSAQLVDCKVDSLELSWEKVAAMQVKAKFMGCGFDPSVVFPVVGTTGEVVSDGVLKGAGGTFTFNGAAARVTGGSIKITNSLEAIQTSDSVMPADMFEGRAAIEVQLKIKPTDLASWRTIVTGTPTGTSVSKDVFYAPFDTKFLGPLGSSLDISAPKAAWTVNMPDATPAGGAAELTLTGRIVTPSGGASPMTAVLINSVATY